MGLSELDKIGVIEKLLADRTTLVVGSAVMAFEEVCPERIELIHKNYRKLCNLLVDVEEWGQVVIINMLSRYNNYPKSSSGYITLLINCLALSTSRFPGANANSLRANGLVSIQLHYC